MPDLFQKKFRPYWLESLKVDEEVAPSLKGSEQTDVAIIGGGYVGLWTALHLKSQDPGCDVTILEQDVCGGGASGRNGGFVLSWWPKISSLIKLLGPEQALRVAKDSQDAITEIQKFSENHQIHSEFRAKGWLWTATSVAQDNAWESVVSLCEKLKVDVFQPLTSQEVADRSGSKIHRSGVLDKTGAILHPGKWVRGLRSVASSMGVRIYENTRIKSFSRSNPLVLRSHCGELRANKIVIATNAWAAGIPELASSIVPITSDMIITAPAPTELKQLGWTRGEGITDSQTMVDYYHVTQDQRVAFGKGGWGIAYGGHLGTNFDQNRERAKMVEADFRRYYPTLQHIPVTHHWCGPIDRTPNSLPLLGSFKSNPNIIYGVGWSGNGVGPSWIGGKVLASLALERKDEWAKYPLVNRSVGRFPPEPIRYLGAHLVRAAVAAKENREIKNETPSWFAVQISKLAPKGLEDKE